MRMTKEQADLHYKRVHRIANRTRHWFETLVLVLVIATVPLSVYHIALIVVLIRVISYFSHGFFHGIIEASHEGQKL